MTAGRPCIGHGVDRNSGSVVRDGDRIVGMQRHLDTIRTPGQGLVNGVVHHFVNEVMQASGPGRPDVHAGSEPDRLETFEDRDVLCCVSCLSH